MPKAAVRRGAGAGLGKRQGRQQELKRRTSKVRVFPNLASLERLSTAVLIDEKWETETKAYIKWEQLDD